MRLVVLPRSLFMCCFVAISRSETSDVDVMAHPALLQARRCKFPCEDAAGRQLVELAKVCELVMGTGRVRGDDGQRKLPASACVHKLCKPQVITELAWLGRSVCVGHCVLRGRVCTVPLGLMLFVRKRVVHLRRL